METSYVASGDFMVASKGRSIKLVALLGTCVGVAVFDKKSKVGGLCHVLLPKPSDPSSVWQPKKYATTSLPLFVDELLQAGAQRDRLEAVVAGGSLCTPISNRDLILNIGGHNIESSVGFLKRHKIPVTFSETGGCNSMRLTFQSADCHVDITHTLPSHHGNLSKTGPLTMRCPDEKEIDEAIESTKPIPQIALKLTQIIRSGDYDIKDVVRELNSDQVLSAKLLGYCNSAFFGFKTKIDSVQKAVTLLGETYLLEAIISAAVNSFFEQEKTGGYALIKGGLFKHSLCVAHLARIIARCSQKEDEHSAYTAGLLHDIGKIVLDSFVGRARHLFYSSPVNEREDLIQAERSQFKCDHQYTGQKLAESWTLPDSIKEVIQYHHNPAQAHGAKMLTHIISVADVLASFFMAGIEIDRVNVNYFDASLEVIGLNKDRLPDIIGQIPWAKIMYS